MNRDLIILRGLPGAGKSTLARSLAGEQWPILSIDNYFTDEGTGEYNFRFKENQFAYKKCEEETEKFMIKNTQKIFIDNTFTLEWEIEPYFKLAWQYGYRVFVATVENRHKGKNHHEISDEQIEKMAEKYKVILF